MKDGRNPFNQASSFTSIQQLMNSPRFIDCYPIDLIYLPLTDDKPDINHSHERSYHIIPN